jgi:periplasmic protein TonB
MTDVGFTGRTSSWLWILSAVCAITLHAGCVALAIAQYDVESPDDALGAPAIEVGLELLAPRAEVTDLPPGPNNEASAASAAATEHEAAPAETELPKDKPTDAEDADRLVALSESRTPTENDLKVDGVEAATSAESAAADAKAMPGIENAPVSTRSIAPVQGTGQSKELVKLTWQKRLVAHLNKYKRYPPKRSAKAAQIVVGFVLDRKGRVLSTSIVKGSGDTSFDEAALAMLRRADPVPPPPPLVADEGLSFTLPVAFRLSKMN